MSEQRTFVIDKRVLVPIGTVIAIASFIFWLGYSYQEVISLKDNQLKQSVKIEQLQSDVASVSSRQTVTESRFEEIKNSIRDLREDLKAYLGVKN